MTLDELLATPRAVITVTECARLLEVDPRTVSAAITAGEIPSVRLGRRVLIPVRRLLPLLIDDPQTDSEAGPASPTIATTDASKERHDQCASNDPGLRSIA